MEDQEPQEQDTVQSPVPATTTENGAKPSRTRGLRPPWPKGVSGNPSGLTKDGKSPKGQALRASLHDELMKSGGMPALARRWIALAKKGNATALQAILERLDPIEKDPMQGRMVLQGIKLELAPGSTAQFMLGQDGAHGAQSFAQSGAEESQSGYPPIQSPSLQAPTLPPSSETPQESRITGTPVPGPENAGT